MRKQLAALGVLCALLPGLVLHTQAAEAPAVSAASAVLMDGETGRVLYAKDENTPRAIASTTKLMTALVAAEYLGGDLSRQVEIQREWTGIEGTSLYLVPGETLSLKTLFYGLLLPSGNDAAVALACACAGDVDTFVGWMNQRAQDLGMTHTHFSDPNGLGDENHYASALDMAKLGRACLQNPTVAEAVVTKSLTLEDRQLVNHNKLLWQYEGCTGMKTGYTRQAGRTLVSSAERDGQTAGAVLMVLDVTEKEAQEQYRREFTANVSHELKTPLQGIIGSAELIENGMVKPDDLPRFVGHIHTEAARLVTLIDDIIRLSQLDEGGELPTEPVDLLTVSQEAAQTLQDAAAARQVTVSVQGEPAVIPGVRRLLYEIVYNLCDNAIKYNRDGGRVDITVVHDADGSSVTVADTGIGIAPEHQARVFERFYRVDKSHSKASGGTGLGLSIVKHAMQLHHGRIELESTPGTGTTIRAIFPKA